MTGIKIEYYAMFREQAGLSEEKITTNADNVAALYHELKIRHDFSLGQDRIRVAVNNEFVDWSAPIADGDVVVFVPPVAGG